MRCPRCALMCPSRRDLSIAYNPVFRRASPYRYRPPSGHSGGYRRCSCQKIPQHHPSPGLHSLFKIFISPSVDCLPRASISLHIICLIKFIGEMFLELRFTVPTPHAVDANEDLSPTLTLPGFRHRRTALVKTVFSCQEKTTLLRSWNVQGLIKANQEREPGCRAANQGPGHV